MNFRQIATSDVKAIQAAVERFFGAGHRFVLTRPLGDTKWIRLGVIRDAAGADVTGLVEIHCRKR